MSKMRLQRSPRPLAGFNGPNSKGRIWKGRGVQERPREGKGKVEGKEREKGSYQYFVFPHFEP